ncbi:MAG: hypothetical protein AAF579_05845 [Cyanobacteria bacterium P01_C01_bin.118]
MTQVIERSISPETKSLTLIRQLCKALEAENVVYCHWKSNAAIDRSASGENDLDVLISRKEARRFTEILYRLGFKQANDPPEKELPGILNFYGYDPGADKFVHVHAHYQLILGQDATKNYRLPIEEPFLASATQADLFKIPEPEFEFIVFVIRMVLKHCTWDTILSLQGALNKTEPQELEELTHQADFDRVQALLTKYFPYLESSFFDDCIRSLSPNSSLGFRIQIGQQLQNKLKAHARQPSQILDSYLKLWRRLAWGVKRKLLKPRKHLTAGGAMIALVGGDGAGKSTAVDELYGWLSKNFTTTNVHLGKPPWSVGTFLTRGAHKAGRLLGLIPKAEVSFYSVKNGQFSGFPGYLWLLREVFTARDRYRQYVKARRFATNGGLVICDRFPLPQIKLMDGVQAGHVVKPEHINWLTRFLLNLEANYYQQIVPPDLLIVLRLDPEIAVQRRAGEDPDWIRSRSQEIWGIDWQNTSAHIVDSGQSKEKVLAEIKALVWQNL